MGKTPVARGRPFFNCRPLLEGVEQLILSAIELAYDDQTGYLSDILPQQLFDIDECRIQFRMLFSGKQLLRVERVSQYQAGCPYKISRGTVPQEHMNGVSIVGVALHPLGVA